MDAKVVYFIRSYDNVQMLTGVGREELTDRHGNLIARFWNGKFDRRVQPRLTTPAEWADMETIVLEAA